MIKSILKLLGDIVILHNVWGKRAVVGAESQKRACDPHYLLVSCVIKMHPKNDSQYHRDVSNIINPHIYEKVVREWVVMNYSSE